MEEEGTVVACRQVSVTRGRKKGSQRQVVPKHRCAAPRGSVRNVKSRTAFGRGRVPPEESSSVLGFIRRSTHSERGREGGRAAYNAAVSVNHLVYKGH